MDVQTPTASVTPEPFTMADANRMVEETQPIETTVTDDKPPTKAEGSATPAQEASIEEPPFLKQEESTDDTFDLDNINYEEVLKDVTDEARKAAHQKGIEKIVQQARAARDEANAAKEAAEEMQARLTPIDSYIKAFDDPEQWEAAYKYLGEQLSKAHGKFVQTQETQSSATQDGSEDQIWESETPSQTKARWTKDIVSEAVKALAPMIEELKGTVEQKLNPVQEWHQKESAKAETLSKLDQNYPTIHGRYPFATKDMVSNAMGQFPSLDPMVAFKAVYADEIGRYAADFAKSLTTKPAGPQVTQAHTQSPVSNGERPTTMAGIREELGLGITTF